LIGHSSEATSDRQKARITSALPVSREDPLPNTPNATFEQLQGFGIINDDLANRLTAADAFKEMVLHNSAAISWETVFCSLPDRLHDFKQFAQAVDDWLSQQPPNVH
jgi:uncharacterized protein YutE (UPF0331/DUF86 family)